jgi:membrane fusion protein (multidrug efflux system)
MKAQHLKLAGFIAASMLAFTIAACGGKDKADDSEKESGDVKKVTADTTAAIPVITTVVKAGAFEDWGTYSADLRGTDDAVLTAPMPGGGRVNKIAGVGTRVAKGQALCDIETDLYQAQLKQAQAALDLAKGEIDRAKSNVEQGFVGKAVQDKAELDYQGARVAHFQATRAYENSRCQAPFAGVLVSRSIEQFQSVAPGAPTVRIAGLNELEALVSIPESESQGYREGQRAEFRQLQGNGKPILGTIRSLDRAVESNNRVVSARVKIGNPGGMLSPGMIGKVRVLRQRYEKALVVASQAVLRLQSGTAVMVVRDGRAHQVPVVLGPSLGDSVVIVSGINAGDRIITVGSFQVSEGTKVKF